MLLASKVLFPIIRREEWTQRATCHSRKALQTIRRGVNSQRQTYNHA